jgi:hypothetical protein
MHKTKKIPIIFLTTWGGGAGVSNLLILMKQCKKVLRLIERQTFLLRETALKTIENFCSFMAFSPVYLWQRVLDSSFLDTTFLISCPFGSLSFSSSIIHDSLRYLSLILSSLQLTVTYSFLFYPMIQSQQLLSFYPSTTGFILFFFPLPLLLSYSTLLTTAFSFSVVQHSFLFFRKFCNSTLFSFFSFTQLTFFQKNITHSPSPQELEWKIRLFLELCSFYILAVLQLTVTTRYGD